MHTPRPSRGSHTLWITDSSKQVAQGQSQAGFDLGVTRVLQIYLIHRNKYKEAAKMGRQRNRAQMKEQEHSLQEELDEIEAKNLSENLE